MARKGRPSASPYSKTWTMFGCLIDATASASARNRIRSFGPSRRPRDHLERDEPVEPELAGLVDQPIPPSPRTSIRS